MADELKNNLEEEFEPEEVIDAEPEHEGLEYPTEEELFSDGCEDPIESHDESLPAMAIASPFTVRTKKPTKNDKYAKNYIRRQNGGWSWCIQGKPTDKECNVLSNCVGYCNGRFNEVYNELKGTTGAKYYALNCDAKDWIERAKKSYPSLKISDTPQPGSVLVMGHKTKAGHVIFVEKVNSPTQIVTSESSYNGSSWYSKVRNYNNGHWGMSSTYYQRGFILNPAVPEVPIITITDSVDRNEYVDQIQIKSSNLRCRTTPSLEGTILGYMKKDGIYNVLDTATTDGYTWYKVAEDNWCALTTAPSLVFLPKIEKLKIGDRVLLNGPLYRRANDTKAAGSAKNKDTYITRYVEGTLHPYNTKGDLGWCDESSMKLIAPDPVEPEQVVPVAHKIIIASVPHGIIEANKFEALPNEVVDVNLKVENGYKVDSFTANNVDIVGSQFIMPDADVMVEAIISPIVYKITCKESLYGDLSVDKDEATLGQKVIVYCQAKEHYKLVTITAAGGAVLQYDDRGNIKFEMPASDVTLSAEYELIVQPIFRVGDRVTILKAGNSQPNGSGITVFNIGTTATISRIIWKDQFDLEEYCYQLQDWDGTQLGFYKEEDLELYKEYVPIEFPVGTQVKIKGKGNSRPDGSGYTVFGIGWKKEVLEYLDGEEFPYKIGKPGTVNIVQGYYKEIDLEEV